MEEEIVKVLIKICNYYKIYNVEEIKKYLQKFNYNKTIF